MDDEIFVHTTGGNSHLPPLGKIGYVEPPEIDGRTALPVGECPAPDKRTLVVGSDFGDSQADADITCHRIAMRIGGIQELRPGTRLTRNGLQRVITGMMERVIPFTRLTTLYRSVRRQKIKVPVVVPTVVISEEILGVPALRSLRLWFDGDEPLHAVILERIRIVQHAIAVIKREPVQSETFDIVFPLPVVERHLTDQLSLHIVHQHRSEPPLRVQVETFGITRRDVFKFRCQRQRSIRIAERHTAAPVTYPGQQHATVSKTVYPVGNLPGHIHLQEKVGIRRIRRFAVIGCETLHLFRQHPLVLVFELHRIGQVGRRYPRQQPRRSNIGRVID